MSIINLQMLYRWESYPPTMLQFTIAIKNMVSSQHLVCGGCLGQAKVFGHGAVSIIIFLQVFGHGAVSVLDGGLGHWKAWQYPVETGIPQIPTPQHYGATYNPHLVKTLDQVMECLKAGSSQVKPGLSCTSSVHSCLHVTSRWQMQDQKVDLRVLQLSHAHPFPADT